LLLIASLVFLCKGQNCSSSPLVVGTFNTQQIITANLRQERLNAQIQFFQQNATNLEVLCLQELWDPTFRQAYIQYLNATFPYSYYPPNFPLNNTDCSAACTTSALQQTTACLSLQNCFQSNTFPDQINCAFGQCRSTFDNLGDSCKACLSVERNIALSDNINNCVSTGGNVRDCIRLFGGYTDNLILSRYPIIQTGYLQFQNSPFTETTVLYSKIQAPQGPVNVFCTHLLPANFRLVDFESVNRDQTQQMIQYINSVVQNTTEPIIAMGDFNSGPAIAPSSGSWENNYILFPNNGFQSALIVANSQPPCTYCTTNSRVNNLLSQSTIIDHIFVKNAQVLAAGLFANFGIVQVGNQLVPLSDHYGVAASLCITGNVTTTPSTNPSTSVIIISPVQRPNVPSTASELVASIALAIFGMFWSLF